MKKLFFSLLAISALSSASAFAQNLGQLSEDRQPKNLKPAEAFVQYANTHEQTAARPHSVAPGTAALRTQHNNDDYCDSDDFLFGLGGLGLGAWDLGLGWGLWPYTSSYFPYYSYYYPYYYGSYYYPYSYGSYYYPYYWSQPNDDQQPRTAARPDSNTRDSVATDRSHTPVVCFAADDAGNWYANVDTANNAVRTQTTLNNECAQSGLNCRQNLGCALATTSAAHE